MDYTRFANWDLFLKENNDKFSNCQYLFYENKCKNIVRKFFHLQEVTEQECLFLEKHSGISIEEWKQVIDEFNYGEELREEEMFREYPMNPNNICSAP